MCKHMQVSTVEIYGCFIVIVLSPKVYVDTMKIFRTGFAKIALVMNKKNIYRNID